MMNFHFWHSDKHQSLLQSNTIIVVVYIQHGQITRNNKFTISLQYLKENVKDQVYFCLLIIVKGFFKVILSF